MHAESVLGLRQAIVGRYERLCQELDTRFGLEPEHETRVLYRRLLSHRPRSVREHLSPAPASLREYAATSPRPPNIRARAPGERR